MNGEDGTKSTDEMLVASSWRWRDALLPALVSLCLSLLFWKVRILDNGVNPTIEVGPVDLYIWAIPMAEYGFNALRSAYLPLWNPYQFCGEPFLGMAYVGLFYPPHLLNVAFGVLPAIEILFVGHMFLGGLGMWYLARHFGFDALSSSCAAVTFAWSGWMVQHNILPLIFEAMSWAPLTVLLVDRILCGARLAGLALAAAVCCQVLTGALEVFLHNLYIVAVFALGRVAQMLWRGAWREVALNGGFALLCLAIGASLAGAQFLPAIELTQQSARAAGTLSFAQVAAIGSIAPDIFLRHGLETTGVITVGVLPLVGGALVLGDRRYRLVWVPALVGAVVAAQLVFGGWLFHLYYALPLVGSMFRRPMKFLDIYCTMQALLVAVAVARLRTWTTAEGVPMRQPSWVAAIGVGVGAILYLAWLHLVNWYLIAAMILLLAFGVLPRPRLRRGVLGVLCALQAVNLFFGTGDNHVRPVKRPEIYHTHDFILDFLERQAGHGRIYLSSRFWFWPGLTAKQGILHQLNVVTDYETLAVGRYGSFFDAVTPRQDTAPFFGSFEMRAESRFQLMDLTSTRYFVMLRGEPGELFMGSKPSEFPLVWQEGALSVFERRQALPRAYFVTRARRLDDPETLLAELGRPSFDPHSEVLLEGSAAPALAPLAGPGNNRVKITSYDPERVVVAADVQTPGYLVLTDLFYPGWKAFIGEREVPLQRANYLFRAVQLQPGSWDVRFEYRPESFRHGIMMSVAAATLLALVAGVCVHRRASISTPCPEPESR